MSRQRARATPQVRLPFGDLPMSVVVSPDSAPAGPPASSLIEGSPPVPAAWSRHITATPTRSKHSAATLLHALRRRWIRGLCVGLAGAVAAIGAMWCLSPPKYQAQALLHVASCTSQGVSGSQSGCETSEQFAAYKATQTTLLQSRPVLDAALKQPFHYLAQQYDDPVESLDNNLHVDTLPGSDILRVTYANENPEWAATILNAVIEAYLKEIARTEQKNRQTCMDQLQAGIHSY